MGKLGSPGGSHGGEVDGVLLKRFEGRNLVAAADVPECRRSLTADGFLARVHNHLGVIYSGRREFAVAAKEYEKARRDIEAALRIDPQFAPARRSLESLRSDLRAP